MIHINLMTTQLRQRLCSRRWRERNPETNRERLKIATKAWRQTSEGQKKFRATKKRYAERTAVVARKRTRLWQILNPDRVHAQHAKRRAKKNQAGGSFTAIEWQELLIRYGHRCLGCGRSESVLLGLGLKIVPDHVNPIACGGTSDINNIQPLCHGRGGCNNKKSDNFIDYRGSYVIAVD